MNLKKLLDRLGFYPAETKLKLIFLGSIVGLLAGFAGFALNTSILFLERHLTVLRPYWWSFIIPGAGAALSYFFLEKILNEGAGHGVPEVIYSVSRKGGLIRARSIFSRIISSGLTIGSGGSAGPEAPIIMSGAAIGSNFARFLKLNERERINMVGCGSAAAIASIFNAPIAGMVFTLEVVLGEWTAVNIVPIAVASVAGAELSRVLRGNQIAFSHESFAIGPGAIVAAVVLALFTSAAALGMTRALRKSHALWHKVELSPWARAFAGGCLVGGLGLAMPMVLGEGYHAVSDAVTGDFHPGFALVAVLVLAKILATATTLGSGGSGGIFAPCLVVGGFAGLAYYRGVGLVLPGIDLGAEGLFALLGMAGMIGGMLQAPLTAIFLIVEVTGDYNVILPLIMVSVLSSTICSIFEPNSYYLRDLEDSGHLLRVGTDARILADLRVAEMLDRDCMVVSDKMKLGEFVDVVKKSSRNFFPVEDEDTGKFLGMIHLDQVRPYLFSREMYDVVLICEIMDAKPAVVAPDDSLTEVLEKMEATRSIRLPVVDGDKYLGMVSKVAALDRYRKELIVQTEK